MLNLIWLSDEWKVLAHIALTQDIYFWLENTQYIFNFLIPLLSEF